MIKKILISSLFILAITSCKQSKEAVKTEKENTTFQFAKNISIEENNETITIKSSGNTITFDKKELPIKTVMVETSSAIAYLNELNVLNTVKGATDVDFIYNPKGTYHGWYNIPASFSVYREMHKYHERLKDEYRKRCTI